MTGPATSRLRRLASPRRPHPPNSPGRRAAAVLLAWPRPLAGLVGTGYTTATLGALLISLTVGLFGFRESIPAFFVVQSIAMETVTALALLAWTILVSATPPSRRPAAPPLAVRFPARQIGRGR